MPTIPSAAAFPEITGERHVHYEPGARISVKVTGGPLEGGILVMVDTTKVDGEMLTVKVCGAGKKPVGVLLWDVADNGLGLIVREGVMRVQCGDVVRAGYEVESDSAGKVIERLAPVEDGSSGVTSVYPGAPVGTAWSDGTDVVGQAAAVDALIALTV